MTDDIKVKLSEAKKVFDFLEKVNDLFHQPMKYKNAAVVESFAVENYAEIKDLYYNVVWEWLPEEAKKEIENR